MDAKIAEALKTDSKFHDALLEYVKKRIDISRCHMQQFYDLWDANDAIIRGERVTDEQDKKAAKRGEPVKLILPFAYAQVHTFIAFFSLLFNQRSFFFEIQDNGIGQYTPEGDAETILDKDLSRNKFSQIQYQCFLDIARSGFCVIKSMWEEETITKQEYEPTTPPEQGNLFPTVLPDVTLKDKTSYVKQGNKICAVSPYKFFPDVRLPLSRMQDGEFCGSEDEYSITRLKQMEANGMMTNTDKIQDLSTGGEGIRRLNQLTSFNGQNFTAMSAGSPGSGMAIVTECEIWISPSEFKDQNGKGYFGTDDKPQLYVVSYANDKTILRAEPLNYEHQQFCYDIGEYSADQIRVVNESLSEIINPMQDLATWFLNSRVTSVRKIIDNKIVVDPEGIEMQDLKDRSPVIRLKPGMGRSGADTWIKQLEVQDVTQGHVNDVTTLWGFMQISTGINDNALGQYNGGRRSAAEARTVNAGAASRLKTIATVLWETLFVPLGQKMLINLANHLSFEMFQRYVGKDADQNRFAAFKDELYSYDFEFFDGTAPSEKGYIAQSMQDLLLGLMTNPMAAQMLSQEPFRSLVVEIADLRGIRSPERFLPPPMARVPIQPIDPNAPANQPPVGGTAGGTAAQA